jgi:hypothetical protein
LNENEQAQTCNPLGLPRVMPANAGIQKSVARPWIPACAGMTLYRSKERRLTAQPAY